MEDIGEADIPSAQDFEAQAIQKPAQQTDFILQTKFKTKGIILYFVLQAASVALIFYVAISLLVALVDPSVISTLLGVLPFILALFVAGATLLQSKRLNAQDVVLTESSVRLTKPGFSPVTVEIPLSIINMIFNSDDHVQSCLGLDEMHILTHMGIKHSVFGVENSQDFIDAVKHQREITNEFENEGSYAAPETTLKERAELHEHKEDVQSLEKLTKLDELSMSELNNLDHRLERMGRRLSHISDSLSRKSDATPRVLEKNDGKTGLVDEVIDEKKDDEDPPSTTREAIDPEAGFA